MDVKTLRPLLDVFQVILVFVKFTVEDKIFEGPSLFCF